jgi:hypothetical protein
MRTVTKVAISSTSLAIGLVCFAANSQSWMAGITGFVSAFAVCIIVYSIETYIAGE